MFYNVKTKTVTEFPDRELLERRIRPTIEGLNTGKDIHVKIFSCKWLVPVDHNTGEYLRAEEVLRLLRRSVGNKEQGVGTDQHARDFVHQVKDSLSIGRATLYSRYVRSLMANCLRRLNPSYDHVSLIQMGDYNVLYFANSDSEGSHDASYAVVGLLCPHVEPDWRMDDFCRREVQLYQHDLYGDRGHFSREEYVQEKGFSEMSDSELREYAYRLNTFACLNSYYNLSREGTYALLYSYQVGNNPRPSLSVEDRLAILPTRIHEGNVTVQEAFYWFRVLGCNYAVALQDCRREAYRSLLLTRVREYEYATKTETTD